MTVKVTHPFKVGDQVIASARLVDNYGYTNARSGLTPLPEFRGKQGVITSISEAKSGIYYPDANVRFGEDEHAYDCIDVCFLAPIPKRIPKSEAHVEKPKSKRLTPQCQLIINHLKSGHSITQRSALMDFNIMSLPRRITDLVEAGYKIDSSMEKNNLTGQRYKRYFLAKTEDKPTEAVAYRIHTPEQSGVAA